MALLEKMVPQVLLVLRGSLARRVQLDWLGRLEKLALVAFLETKVVGASLE